MNFFMHHSNAYLFLYNFQLKAYQSRKKGKFSVKLVFGAIILEIETAEWLHKNQFFINMAFYKYVVCRNLNIESARKNLIRAMKELIH